MLLHNLCQIHIYKKSVSPSVRLTLLYNKFLDLNCFLRPLLVPLYLELKLGIEAFE
jgi:hypothetical protein